MVIEIAWNEWSLTLNGTFMGLKEFGKSSVGGLVFVIQAIFLFGIKVFFVRFSVSYYFIDIGVVMMVVILWVCIFLNLAFLFFTVMIRSERMILYSFWFLFLFWFIP